MCPAKDQITSGNPFVCGRAGGMNQEARLAYPKSRPASGWRGPTGQQWAGARHLRDVQDPARRHWRRWRVAVDAFTSADRRHGPPPLTTAAAGWPAMTTTTTTTTAMARTLCKSARDANATHSIVQKRPRRRAPTDQPASKQAERLMRPHPPESLRNSAEADRHGGRSEARDDNEAKRLRSASLRDSRSFARRDLAGDETEIKLRRPT